MHHQHTFSQPTPASARQRHLSLFLGVLYGVVICLYVNLWEPLNMFVTNAWAHCPGCNGHFPEETPLLFGQLGFLFLCLTAPFLAGLSSARQTGRIMDALLAGMWTGSFGSLFTILLTFLLFRVNWASGSPLSLAELALPGLITVLVSSTLSCGVGTIGGLFGIQRKLPQKWARSTMWFCLSFGERVS